MSDGSSDLSIRCLVLMCVLHCVNLGSTQLCLPQATQQCTCCINVITPWVGPKIFAASLQFKAFNAAISTSITSVRLSCSGSLEPTIFLSTRTLQRGCLFY